MWGIGSVDIPKTACTLQLPNEFSIFESRTSAVMSIVGDSKHHCHHYSHQQEASTNWRRNPFPWILTPVAATPKISKDVCAGIPKTRGCVIHPQPICVSSKLLLIAGRWQVLSSPGTTWASLCTGREILTIIFRSKCHMFSACWMQHGAGDTGDMEIWSTVLQHGFGDAPKS